MKLFKENKKSSAIEDRIGGTCIILSVQQKEYEGYKVTHVVFTDQDGDLHERSCYNPDLKAGSATFVDTLWSKESKFGDKPTIRFTNID